MKNYIRATALAAAALGLASRGGGTTQPQLIGEIPVPNNPPKFTFDIGYVDQGKYFITDRTNKALDIFDTGSYKLIASIQGGFAGQDPGVPTNNDKSGPDGCNGIPGTNTIYVGDVSSVKIVDIGTKSVTNLPIKSPVTGTITGYRADEGCYDPDDNLMMFSHPGDATPFATFISTVSKSIVAQLPFVDPTGAPSGGLEACIYDHATKSFFVNNDATTANPDGEVDVIPAASVVAGTPTINAVYPLPGCNPTGLATGPGNEMLISCVPSLGKALASPIMDKTTGKTIATVKLGGADQIAYDSVTNRYYMAQRFWNDTGISTVLPSGVAYTGLSPQYNPILGIIDASSHAIVAKLPSGKNAHSVAIDGPNHKAFVPHDSGSTAFPNTGITVYSTQ